MKNTFGNTLTVTLFGESHGPAIGAVLDGIAPGIRVDEDAIRDRLRRRRPSGAIGTARVEADEYTLVSGVYRGYTTGTPLTVLIPNANTKSEDYKSCAGIPRPGHADYTGYIKYGGYADPRGGGHFSGRITAALVAVGAIVEEALKEKGILIGTHVESLGGICDRELADSEDLRALCASDFPVFDPSRGKKMKEAILHAKKSGDSIGGVLGTYVLGVPAGIGEPWFDTVEGQLAKAIFSVPGIKGVSFGAGFGIASMAGSEANDPFRMRGDAVTTVSNHAGGINGGITNGMPILIHSAVRPTPSIYKEQKSVNLATGKDENLTVAGRHDPAIVHRAAVVVSALTALVIADLLCERFGTGYLAAGMREEEK